MRYILSLWKHDCSDEPVTIYSELDDDSYEVRKIEYFRDGLIGHADRNGTTGRTRLGLAPVPEIQEINLDPQFLAVEIHREQFELIWISTRPMARSQATGPS